MSLPLCRRLKELLAIGEKLPTMNSIRGYVEAGGLISYGPNFPDVFRRAGDFVNKILRGIKPADLPVEQPVKFVDPWRGRNRGRSCSAHIPDATHGGDSYGARGPVSQHLSCRGLAQ